MERRADLGNDVAFSSDMAAPSRPDRRRSSPSSPTRWSRGRTRGRRGQLRSPNRWVPPSAP